MKNDKHSEIEDRYFCLGKIDNAILDGTKIDDFLPPPELLGAKEETKKITISLSKRSIEFFKQASKMNHIPYQQMIRKVIDNYAEHYSK